MRCVVTMKETESKFQNIPLSIEARKAAKALMESNEILYPTMKKALWKLRESFAKEMVEKLTDDVKTTQE